ncbi:hypothetical protein GJ688_12990 [Heliobacillus mobilis]|uniref:Ig-like domain (Group 3) n=1 Tax=Heliobacterium mobile TaxID=28064 RepID=A0A6I3SLW8_HELMO|nr:hypothetical protein [Heliobacterium mobile]MTV49889.1 hypothetical protein [Heliobacterium mobile]
MDPVTGVVSAKAEGTIKVTATASLNGKTATKSIDLNITKVAEKIAPVITTVASVDVTADKQVFTFTVADEVGGSGVDANSIVVKQGTAELKVTAVTGQDNTYQVSLNEVAGADQTLTIDAKDLSGNAATQAKVTLVDKVKPTIKSVQALNNKTLLVTFSEPVADSALTVTSKYALYNKTNGISNSFVTTSGASDLNAVAAFANTEKTQIKFIISAGASVNGYPLGGLSNGGYIFYATGVDDKATSANTIIASSPTEFTGTLTPDSSAPALLSSSFNNASGAVTLVFDKATTGAAPADDKVYFQVGSQKVLLKATDYDGSGTSTAIAGTSTVTFTVEAATLNSINALGATPQIVLADGAFTDGANTTALTTTTPTIVTGPILSAVTYDENTNTAVYKFSKTIDVSEITTFAGSKFMLGGVDIQDANLVFNNTGDSTDLSFKLSDAKAQAVETQLRLGTLTASVAAGTVKDTDATPNSNVAASSSATLVVGTSYIKDTTAPTLTAVKFNKDTDVVEFTFNEKVRNNIADFTKASIEFYKDDNGIAGLQTTGTTPDTKIATFADTDTLSGTDDHAIDGTAGYFVSDATGATPATGNSEVTTIYVKDTDATGTHNLDDSLDAAVAASKDIYVNILAGGFKDANTTATTVDQSAKMTVVTISNAADVTSATTIDGDNTTDSLGYINVEFKNGSGAVAVDPATATVKGNYDLYLTANPLSKVEINKVVMNATNTVATLYLKNPLTVSSSYSLKTSGIKTATGKSGDITTAEVITAAADSTTLSATQALVLTDKDASGTVSAGDTIAITFNEPIKLPGTFTLSNLTVSNSHTLGNSTYSLSDDSTTLTITVGSTSTIAVGDTITFPTTVTDYANNALASGADQTTNAMTVSGNSAPTISSVVYADTNGDGVVGVDDTLTITTSQNVYIKTGKVAADLNNEININGHNDQVKSVSINGKVLTVTLNGSANASDLTAANVKFSGGDGDLVNVWGTAAADSTGVTLAYADTTAPTLANLKYDISDKKLTLVFSEAVNIDSATNATDVARMIFGKYSVDASSTNGSIPTTDATLSSDKKEVSIVLGGSPAIDATTVFTVTAGAFDADATAGTDGTNEVIADASGNKAIRAKSTYTATVTE